MMKKLFTGALGSMATLAIFVANSGIGPCSSFVFYEPEIPECLKK
ncbi:MAG: cyclic lactone autoinducer peptide [Syntrophomonadaceae bacterium]|jgi:cyclic lactone autoinducer peptide